MGQILLHMFQGLFKNVIFRFFYIKKSYFRFFFTWTGLFNILYPTSFKGDHVKNENARKENCGGCIKPPSLFGVRKKISSS